MSDRRYFFRQAVALTAGLATREGSARQHRSVLSLGRGI